MSALADLGDTGPHSGETARRLQALGLIECEIGWRLTAAGRVWCEDRWPHLHVAPTTDGEQR